jgi:hypothetical protein
MASLVYITCAVTSALCALLLTRGYLRSKDRLLLWSSCCFVFFFISNVLLVVDLAILPNTTDLSVIRTIPSLAGVAIMLYGLIWESR